MAAVFDGLFVVDFGLSSATSMASMLLADNGAEVVKVEPPGGDPLRSKPAWLMWNRGKQSIVLDLTSNADAQTARKLMNDADVVLENWPAGESLVTELDYTSVAQDNPGLIYCTVSAMGPLGPYAKLPCVDAVVEACCGGYMDLSVYMERSQPSFRARPNPSYATANLAVQGISAALMARETDGLGQHLETSLYQGYLAFDYQGALRRQNELGFLEPPQPLAPFPKIHPILPYLVVRCLDGQWMQITNQTARLFKQWMTVLEIDHIWEDPRWSGAPGRFPDQESKEALASSHP